MRGQSGKDMVSKNKNKKKQKPKFQTFQETILNLQKFWSKQGCIILQPYDMEVGAGTFHPATTLDRWAPNLGKSLMFNHQEDQPMVDMVKILTGFSIIINFKF